MSQGAAETSCRRDCRDCQDYIVEIVYEGTMLDPFVEMGLLDPAVSKSHCICIPLWKRRIFHTQVAPRRTSNVGACRSRSQHGISVWISLARS
jgi:hypothetical protein